MAGSTGRTTGLQVQWYYKAGHSTLSDPIAYADFVGANKLVLAANEIKNAVGDVTIGTQDASASEPVFNQQTEYEYAIPGTPAPFSLEVQFDDSDAIHAAIDEADAGTDCEVACVVTTATDQVTVRVVRGELKATQQTYSAAGVQKMSIPVAVAAIYKVKES